MPPVRRDFMALPTEIRCEVYAHVLAGIEITLVAAEYIIDPIYDYAAGEYRFGVFGVSRQVYIESKTIAEEQLLFRFLVHASVSDYFSRAPGTYHLRTPRWEFSRIRNIDINIFQHESDRPAIKEHVRRLITVLGGCEKAKCLTVILHWWDPTQQQAANEVMGAFEDLRCREHNMKIRGLGKGRLLLWNQGHLAFAPEPLTVFEFE